MKAGGGTRTRNLLLTKQLLCRLSHASDGAFRPPAVLFARGAVSSPADAIYGGVKVPEGAAPGSSIVSTVIDSLRPSQRSTRTTRGTKSPSRAELHPS